MLEERSKSGGWRTELKVASEIQMRLQLSRLQNRRVGHDRVSFPCREIGGELLRLHQTKRDNRLVVAVAMCQARNRRALLMSSLHAAVRAQSQTRSTISEVRARSCLYLRNSPRINSLRVLWRARARDGHSPLLQRRAQYSVSAGALERDRLPRQGRTPDRDDAERRCG